MSQHAWKLHVSTVLHACHTFRNCRQQVVSKLFKIITAQFRYYFTDGIFVIVTVLAQVFLLHECAMKSNENLYLIICIRSPEPVQGF